MKLNLPIIKLKIDYQALDYINFSSYTGSLFRGAFGNQLRKIACLSKQENCNGCGIYKTCPYATIFESKMYQDTKNGSQLVSQPNPYVLEPLPIGRQIVKKDEVFSINIILFGKAIEQISLVILALIRAGAKGFTSAYIPAKLCKISQITEESESTLYDISISHEFLDEWKTVYSCIIPDNVNELKVTLLTPTRFVIKGSNIGQKELTAEVFLQSAVRRVGKLFKNYAIKDLNENIFIPESELQDVIKSIEIFDKNIRWYDWARYSSRQNRNVQLGGLIGEFKLKGQLSKLLPYLHACQILHLGKSAVMGMGFFSIDYK